MQALTKRQMALAAVIYSLGILYILTDQLYIPQAHRFIALLGVQIGMFVVLFLKIPSKTPFRLALSLAIELSCFVIPLYVVNDLILNQNFTLKPLIITLCSLLFPFFVGGFFKILQGIRTRG